MNKKIWTIIKREYLTRARTKGFIIGTLLFPLILILIFSGVFLFSLIIKPSTQSFYVIDRTGKIYPEFTRQLSDTLKNGQPKYLFTEQNVPADSAGQEAELEKFQQLIRNKTITGYLIIPNDVVDTRTVRYSARNISDWEIFQQMEGVLSRIVTNFRLERIGLSPEQVRKEMDQGWVHLETRQVTSQGEIAKSGMSSFGLTYVLGYLLFLMIMIYGQILMRSVIEEKVQRITETIISAVKPIELMLGKIIGICLLGLTQVVVVGIMILLMLNFAPSIFQQFGVTDVGFLGFIRQIDFSPSVFTFLVAFFFLGFFFYAAIYAALGAMVNTEDEGQQIQTFIIFILIAGFFMMIPIIKSPETVSAFWLSLIPTWTPIVMFARICVSDPTLPSGAILSVFTMLASTILVVWVTAKIYRVGILMYGKKASFKEALKWVRYK